jgi:hypothetical protein
VASSDVIAKKSGGRGACAAGPVSASIVVPSHDPQAETDVYQVPGARALDVTLLGRAVTVERGNVCGLLAGCLRDVRLVTLVLPILLLFCFLLFFSLMGCFFNQSC